MALSPVPRALPVSHSKSFLAAEYNKKCYRERTLKYKEKRSPCCHGAHNLFGIRGCERVPASPHRQPLASHHTAAFTDYKTQCLSTMGLVWPVIGEARQGRATLFLILLPSIEQSLLTLSSRLPESRFDTAYHYPCISDLLCSEHQLVFHLHPELL